MTIPTPPALRLATPGRARALPSSGKNILHPRLARLPRAVEMILSALEMASSGSDDQRSLHRRPYRVRAALRLFSDPKDAPAWILYTRDVNARGIGFITPHLLPLGYGGILQIESPARQLLSLDCTLLRCRNVSQGWYEGSLCFNRTRTEFES